ncbi:hypothetical protein HHL17_22045 [Chitinophaga sp. G-6-1-13]|uniref:HEAT repeat domain-containing protein n=1 Tax=Chitinophaga fulva TaxID=2728842 RepID=A0A848GW35_9BACT|nr:hypothetical protein [Chitinophaga fulva]NML39898.1 hypothetical protein [Chitinophaga fulva]
MNFSTHIQTLHHPGSKEKKLHALAQMHNDGYSSLIHNLLIALHQSHNVSIRDTICDTIIHLFQKNIDPRPLYQALNNCEISVADIDFFEATFDQSRLTYLLIISSLNSSGYVREKAVRKLGEIVNAEALPFLLHRLADWVKPVRQAAETAVIAYLHSGKAKAFIMNLSLLEWLQQVERADLTAIRNTILDYLTGRARSVARHQFHRLPVKQRLLLARHLAASCAHRDELLMFMADRYPLIRQVAVEYMSYLQSEDISRLLKDKSPHIRLAVLRTLQQQDSDFSLVPFVADPAAGIREFARYYLKDKGIDFVAIYLDQLQQQQQLTGSLTGLAEMNARQHASVITPFLHHNILRVAKAAFFALKKLDDTLCYNYCLEYMDHPVLSMRHIILDYLANQANDNVLHKAREHYLNGTTDLKLSMLRFFSYTGGWKVAADLMLGTIDPDQSIRDYSLPALLRWQRSTVYLYPPLSAADRERALTILRFATEMHDQHQYFTKNPLHGLDFYFR